MSQQWLQVVGLVVEYFGVLLLAWEWFTARRQDDTERNIAELQARREEMRALMQRGSGTNPQMQRHLDMTRDIDRRRAAAEVDDARRRYGGLRGRVVVLSLAVITAGFLLQLAGSVPGCCVALGIAPAG